MTSAAELTRRLGGRWQGRYGIARCIAHRDHNPSLSIIDGERGPILTCFAGCDWRDIRAELQRRGLLEGKTRQPPRIQFTVKPSSQDRSKRRQHEKAAWLWSQRRPIEGTLAECYLRGRGYSGVIPKTLAFLPPNKPEHHPAMIAAYALVDEPEPAVLSSPRDVLAVHLTLLRPEGGKAVVEQPKLTVASPLGRPIVLAPPNDLLGLAITEGIEDALTVHRATGLGAWAAGSAPLMSALADVVPYYIQTATIYAHDDGGRQNALQLADCLRMRGIEVFVEGLAP